MEGHEPRLFFSFSSLPWELADQENIKSIVIRTADIAS